MAVYFKEILVSSPWKWRENSVETCRSYAKDFNHMLRISAFVVVTWFIYCIIMQRISNVKFIRICFPISNSWPDNRSIHVFRKVHFNKKRENSKLENICWLEFRTIQIGNTLQYVQFLIQIIDMIVLQKRNISVYAKPTWNMHMWWIQMKTLKADTCE